MKAAYVQSLRRHVEHVRDTTGDVPVLDPATVLKVLTALDETREALRSAHSRLSLIRHRAGSRIAWGFGLDTDSVGTEYECDQILGQAARVLGYGPGGDGNGG